MAAVCLGAGGQARAQDARALLTKTVQAYHNLNTYSGKGAVEINMVVGQQRNTTSALSSELLYKRPNKLVVRMNSRDGATDIYSDGGRLMVYKDVGQKYSAGPSAPTLSAMFPLLEERAGVSALLDPLYFLSSAGLPAELGELKTEGSAKVNGHDVAVVSGIWQGPPPVGQAKNPFCRKGARWTLYLDKGSALLQKVEARVPAKIVMRGQQDGKPKVVSMTGAMVMTYNIIDAAPNPALDDKAFVFVPPKGATEQKNLGDLLKGKTP